MPPSKDFLTQLQDVFLCETEDHVGMLEELFLSFEKNPCAGPELDQIFRLVHTIKGSAKSVGLDQLGSFAHHVEDLLVKIRRGDLAVTAEVMNTLLKANDKLAESVRSLRSDRGATCDASAIEASINRIFKTGITVAEADALRKATDGDIVFIGNEGSSNDDAEPATIEKRRPHAGKKSDQGTSTSQANEDFLRVPLQKIDTILNLFGEQIILQSGLDHLKAQISNDQARSIITQLGKVTYELQQMAMSLRMVSLKSFFGKMERVVRDASSHLRKTVNFVRQGESTELDKTIVDELQGVIPHLLRNAIDHGLESSEERIRAGKPAEGMLEVCAYHEGGFFFLKVRDDGRGINKERLLELGRAKGLFQSDNPSDNEIMSLIFVSGLSTKEQTSEISGRGIGMDAVKASIDSMRGTLTFQSESGVGTQFIIKLPLSMAIFNGMIFNVGPSRYVLPSSRILDVHRYRGGELRPLGGIEHVMLKGEEKIPFFSVADLLRVRAKDVESDRRIAFIVESQGKRVALGVDSILGQSRVVQKKIGSELDALTGVSGGAILGDGQIALVLNLDELLHP